MKRGWSYVDEEWMESYVDEGIESYVDEEWMEGYVDEGMESYVDKRWRVMWMKRWRVMWMRGGRVMWMNERRVWTLDRRHVWMQRWRRECVAVCPRLKGRRGKIVSMSTYPVLSE